MYRYKRASSPVWNWLVFIPILWIFARPLRAYKHNYYMHIIKTQNKMESTWWIGLHSGLRSWLLYCSIVQYKTTNINTFVYSLTNPICKHPLYVCVIIVLTHSNWLPLQSQSFCTSVSCSQSSSQSIVFLDLHWCWNPGLTIKMAMGSSVYLPEPLQYEDARSWFEWIEVCAAPNEWNSAKQLPRLPALLRGRVWAIYVSLSYADKEMYAKPSWRGCIPTQVKSVICRHHCQGMGAPIDI